MQRGVPPCDPECENSSTNHFTLFGDIMPAYVSSNSYILAALNEIEAAQSHAANALDFLKASGHDHEVQGGLPTVLRFLHDEHESLLDLAPTPREADEDEIAEAGGVPPASLQETVKVKKRKTEQKPHRTPPQK